MATVNVPFVATLTGAGAAQLETVKQETYNFTGAADIVLNNTLTDDIIAGFVMSQEVSGSTVALNVDMISNSAAFEAALKTALKTASITSEATALEGVYAINALTDKLEQYLVKYSRQEIDHDLAANTIGAAIEASAVKNLAYASHDAECEAAAAAMYTGLNDLGADVRRLVATQLPKGNFPADFSSALPINTGDKMVFRFLANLSVNVTEDAQDLGGSSDSGASGSASAGSGPGVGSGYGIPSRTVELILTKA